MPLFLLNITVFPSQNFPMHIFVHNDEVFMIWYSWIIVKREIYQEKKVNWMSDFWVLMKGIYSLTLGTALSFDASSLYGRDSSVRSRFALWIVQSKGKNLFINSLLFHFSDLDCCLVFLIHREGGVLALLALFWKFQIVARTLLLKSLLNSFFIDFIVQLLSLHGCVHINFWILIKQQVRWWTQLHQHPRNSKVVNPKHLYNFTSALVLKLERILSDCTCNVGSKC